MSNNVLGPDDQNSATYADSDVFAEQLLRGRDANASLGEYTLSDEDLLEYITGHSQRDGLFEQGYDYDQLVYPSTAPGKSPLLSQELAEEHWESSVKDTNLYGFSGAASECNIDPILEASPYATMDQRDSRLLMHPQCIAAGYRTEECTTQQLVPNTTPYLPGYTIPTLQYNDMCTSTDQWQPQPLHSISVQAQLFPQAQHENSAFSPLVTSPSGIDVPTEDCHTTLHLATHSAKAPARRTRPTRQSVTAKAYTPTLRGSKESCVEPMCDKLYVPNPGRPGGRCPKCYDKHQKELAKNTPPYFQYTGHASFESCRETLYPSLQPLLLPNDDVHVAKQHEDGYVQVLLDALNQEYRGESADLGSQIDEGRYDAQKEFNQKPINQRERYEVEVVNKRLRVLFHAAVRYHEGGESIYPAGGDNYSYGDVRDMIFSKRIQMIIDAMKIDKCVCMDVIEGRGVCGLVSNPVKYTKRKEDNYNSNMKKRGALRELAEQKKKEKAEQADELAADAKSAVQDRGHVQRGSAHPVPHVAPSEISTLDTVISRPEHSAAAVEVLGSPAVNAGKRRRLSDKNQTSPPSVAKRVKESSSFSEFVFGEENLEFPPYAANDNEPG